MKTNLEIDLPPDVSKGEARLLLSIKMYEMEKISLGKASEIAGIPLSNLIDILGQHKIAIFRDSPERLEQDLDTLRKLDEKDHC